MKYILGKRTVSVIMALLTGIIALTLGSCNNTAKSYTPIFISYFGFDSFPDFDDYTFYIDNFAHKIYNTDSFPFQSKVDSLFPTIAAGSDEGTFTMNGKKWTSKDTLDFSKSPVRMVYTAENGTDTYTYDIYVNIHQIDPDSLQMHRVATLPVMDEYRTVYADNQIVLFESDGFDVYMYKSYDGLNWEGPLPVSITLAPGSELIVKSFTCKGKTAFMIDNKGGLYSSRLMDGAGDLNVDGLLSWSKVDSIPYVTTLQGILEGRYYPDGTSDPDILLAIVKMDEDLHFAKFEGYWETGITDPVAGGDWVCNGEALPDDFPVSSFAICHSYTQTGLHYVIVAGGRNKDGEKCRTTWSSMVPVTPSSKDDEVYWARISTDYSVIGEQYDASMFYYDDCLFMYGGKYENAVGSVVQDNTLYISSNQGLTWEVADQRLAFRVFNETALCRQVISSDPYLWVFSFQDGEEGVWKGYINRMLFEE